MRARVGESSDSGGGCSLRRSGSWSLGVVAPISAIALVLGADAVEGPRTAYVGVLAVVPMFAAVFAGPVVTAVIGAVTWLAALTFGMTVSGGSIQAQSLRLGVIAIVSILAIVASALRLRQEHRIVRAEQEAATIAEVRRLSETDELTGLLNRRGLLKAIDGTEGFAERMIALIDIDNLKQVNDSYGHQVGDLYITAVARRLSASLAGTDLIGRWGGDEFLIVLDLPGSRSGLVLDRARAAVTSNPVGAGDRLLPVSVSVGAADWPARQPLDASLALADAALYEAKSAGRNRTSYER